MMREENGPSHPARRWKKKGKLWARILSCLGQGFKSSKGEEEEEHAIPSVAGERTPAWARNGAVHGGLWLQEGPGKRKRKTFCRLRGAQRGREPGRAMP